MHQTSYVPDEYYQAGDVVHASVLNQTTLTWEWQYPIRSAFWLYPVILLAKLLHVFDLYRLVNIQDPNYDLL